MNIKYLNLTMPGRGRTKLLFLSGLASRGELISRAGTGFQPAQPFRQPYPVGLDNRFASEQNAPCQAASDEPPTSPCFSLWRSIVTALSWGKRHGALGDLAAA